MTTPPTNMLSAMNHIFTQPMLMDSRDAVALLSKAAGRMAMAMSTGIPTMAGIPPQSRLLRRVGSCLILAIKGAVMFDQLDAYWLDGTWTREIVAACREAKEDSAQDVVAEFDTCGGSLQGTDDVIEALKGLTAAKRVHAVVHEKALSAGYLYATQCSRIVMTRSALVGSVGGVLQITDMSKMLAVAGIEVFNAKTGPLKDAGDPTQALSPEAKQYFVELVTAATEQFFDCVAESRALSLDEVRGLGARVYHARDGLRAHLVDAIAPFEEYVRLVSGGAWDQCQAIETTCDDLPANDAGEEDPEEPTAPEAAGRSGVTKTPAKESNMAKPNEGAGAGAVAPATAAAPAKIETLADLRAAYPALVAEAESKATAPAPGPATLAQLKVVAPGPELATFREECLEAGRTVEQATTAYAALLRTENATLRTAQASQAAATPGVLALAREPDGRATALATGATAATKGGAGITNAFLVAFKSNLQSGMSRGAATSAAAKAHPEAHREWVGEGAQGLDKITA